MSNQREMVLDSQMDILDSAIIAISRAIDELDEADRFPDLDTKDAIFKLEAIRQDLEDQYMLIEDELRHIEA
ncbi:MAG: hypothetical protein EBZ71_03255 [Proteobacteria bacterium]|nr:hypothetical protein [Pseudomonadota bacterium]